MAIFDPNRERYSIPFASPQSRYVWVHGDLPESVVSDLVVPVVFGSDFPPGFASDPYGAIIQAYSKVLVLPFEHFKVWNLLHNNLKGSAPLSGLIRRHLATSLIIGLKRCIIHDDCRSNYVMGLDCFFQNGG